VRICGREFRADACRKKGGVWDGRQCQPKSNPADECRKKGKVWDGQRCLGQGEQCKARGGVWDKNTKTCRPAGREVPR
jgi:hypothetical protein